ncbi:MAG: hypothetical protein U0441_11725 [Polyangiaceae bacterium]
MNRLSHWISVACAVVAFVAIGGGGCNRNKGDQAAADPAAMSAEAALVEERDEGKLEWWVAANGDVRVKVTVNDGAPPALAGSLLLDGQAFPMKADGAALTTTIPKLTADLTTITYSLKVGDATWDGALQVPPGGTKELVAAPAVTIPEGAKGPHGGTLDVVGEQRVEMVVDPKTNEVRVYFLDDKLQPIPVGSASAVAGFLQNNDAPPAGSAQNGGSMQIPAPSQGK